MSLTPQYFVDDDLLMPRAPWEAKRRWLRTAIQFAESYNESYDDLVEDGWTFFDFLGDSLGSLPKLEENGTGYVVENAPIENAAYYFLDGHWLPVRGIAGGSWIDRAWAFMSVDDPTEIDDDSWEGGVHGTPIFVSMQGKFDLGMASRVVIRFMQLRVAKCIQNALCLDHRGRPRNS